MRVLSLAIILIAAGQSAHADQSPVTGFFRYFSSSDPGDGSEQLACVFGFFKQEADGSGYDYMLDQSKFAATGQISYRIASTFDCNYYAATQSEVCALRSSFPDGENTTSYFRYLNITTDEVEVISFGSLLDLMAAARDTPPETPDKMVRCDGWTDEALKSFIDATPVTAADEEILNGWNYPFSGSEAAQNRENAQKILQAILGE
jgi:hypothetical protein